MYYANSFDTNMGEESSLALLFSAQLARYWRGSDRSRFIFGVLTWAYVDRVLFKIRRELTNVQAVLKIIKHCTESLPQMVAGSLLGLDQTGVLEVRRV